jgi:Protein of unknown function (DUF3810)
MIFRARKKRRLAWVLPALALLTFISSWTSIFPRSAIERWYARLIFPAVSHAMGRLADLVSFSWLDVAVPLGAVLLVLLVRRRRWTLLANIIAALYLIFFWTWGLNYHREPLDAKLPFDSARLEPQPMMEFSRRAAAELNRLYLEKQKHEYDDASTRAEAVRRVRKVVDVIDGSDWESAKRIKVSRIGNPWLRAAGIDGVFNPFPHEPVISDSLLEIERPFVMAHEAAHVRGYPNEADANVIAAFATLMSDDPSFQYSGWLNLWLYLRTPELDELLDPGPREDLRRIFERAQREQIHWISDFQRSLLDLFLKANNVAEGVHSYALVVQLAAGSEPFWDRFR